MVDRLFREPRLAELYDLWDPAGGRDDFAFYLPLVMSVGRALDVGCGTGELLRLARERGHRGRLVGLDPADAMLALARVRSDIQWVLGEVGSADIHGAFDLIVMTGHAFQVLLTDDELRTALSRVRSLLAEDGRFVFETRNPAAHAWESWTPEHAVMVTGPTGATVSMAHSLVSVDGDLVTFDLEFTSPVWERPETSRSTLRFLDAPTLQRFLSDAGLSVAEQYGDWDRRPVTASSPEIITATRRAQES